MPAVYLTVDSGDSRNALGGLLERFQESALADVFEDAAQYMVRSTQNRILRTKTGPDGERWPGLSELTIDLKGHDRPLFHTGELARSINVEYAGNEGFSLAADAEYASYMQYGVERVRGSVFNPRTGRRARPTGPIPARPFMGFSQANIQRIARMLRDHIAGDS